MRAWRHIFEGIPACGIRGLIGPAIAIDELDKLYTDAREHAAGFVRDRPLNPAGLRGRRGRHQRQGEERHDERVESQLSNHAVRFHQPLYGAAVQVDGPFGKLP